MTSPGSTALAGIVVEALGELLRDNLDNLRSARDILDDLGGRVGTGLAGALTELLESLGGEAQS